MAQTLESLDGISANNPSGSCRVPIIDAIPRLALGVRRCNSPSSPETQLHFTFFTLFTLITRNPDNTVRSFGAQPFGPCKSATAHAGSGFCMRPSTAIDRHRPPVESNPERPRATGGAETGDLEQQIMSDRVQLTGRRWNAVPGVVGARTDCRRRMHRHQPQKGAAGLAQYWFLGFLSSSSDQIISLSGRPFPPPHAVSRTLRFVATLSAGAPSARLFWSFLSFLLHQTATSRAWMRPGSAKANSTRGSAHNRRCEPE